MTARTLDKKTKTLDPEKPEDMTPHAAQERREVVGRQQERQDADAVQQTQRKTIKELGELLRQYTAALAHARAGLLDIAGAARHGDATTVNMAARAQASLDMLKEVGPAE